MNMYSEAFKMLKNSILGNDFIILLVAIVSFLMFKTALIKASIVFGLMAIRRILKPEKKKSIAMIGLSSMKVKISHDFIKG